MSKTLAARVVSALDRCLTDVQRPVALHEPCFSGNEWQYVKECIDTGWVSTAGRFVNEFEDRLAEFTGARRAVAVVNGTAALHIGLKLAGVLAEDEVLLPTLTFVATANAVAYCNAIPHFVDSEEFSLGIAADKLDIYLSEIVENRDGVCFNRITGRPIRALVVMHTFGHPSDLDGLIEVCSKYSIVLVEDAAEALGSFYKGQHVGNRGLISALSFNGNKIVTAGGGGAILTNDEQLGTLAKHLTTTAKIAHQLEFTHDAVGYNYRMPNLNAALACAQLENLGDFVMKKRALAARYQEVFKDIPQVRFFTEQQHVRSNYWLNALLLDREQAYERSNILSATHSAGFLTRPAWTLMHRLPMFLSCPRMNLATAEDLFGRIVNLPSSACL